MKKSNLLSQIWFAKLKIWELKRS